MSVTDWEKFEDLVQEGCPEIEAYRMATPTGFLIEVPSCADCGTSRRHFNGEPLRDGSPCLNCGSLVRLAPRKSGQVKGDLES